MNNSILTSIKKLLGLSEEYEYFDIDIITYINSTFSILYQLGLDSAKNFFISDKTTTWNELIKDEDNLELVKTYIYLKVKILFDPPNSSIVMDSINRMIAETEFRIIAITGTNH